MNHLLVHLVALSGSFLLTLPAGWCSGLSEPADRAPVRSGCCNAPNDESRSQELPGEPVVECCCSGETTLSQKTVQPDESVSADLPFPTDVLADLGSTTSGALKRVVPLDDGPLHVLRCVWLC